MALFRRHKDAASPEPEPEPEPSTPGLGRQVDELNAGEERWLALLRNELLEESVDPSDIQSLSDYYDRSFAAWTALDEIARPDPNPMINRIGAGLGEHLVTRTGLRWVVASDEQGTGLALHGQPGEVFLWPLNMVAKRWVSAETGFIVELVEATVPAVASLRSGSA